MALYTIKWTEVHHHEVDIAADGPEEALEQFWVDWNDADGGESWLSSTIGISGPQDIKVHHNIAVVDINVTGGQV